MNWLFNEEPTHYGFDELVAMRRPEALDAKSSMDAQRAYHSRCHVAMEKLADKWEEIGAEVAVILGNDQDEIYATDELNPAFMVFFGDTIPSYPQSEEAKKKLPPGVAEGEHESHDKGDDDRQHGRSTAIGGVGHDDTTFGSYGGGLTTRRPVGRVRLQDAATTRSGLAREPGARTGEVHGWRCDHPTGPLSGNEAARLGDVRLLVRWVRADCRSLVGGQVWTRRNR